MYRVAVPLIALAVAACETTSPITYAPEDFRVTLSPDEETGRLTASTRGSQSFEHTRAYDNMSNQYLVFWLEAVKLEPEGNQIYIVGDRVRFRTEESVGSEGRTGRIDVDQPAWVGPKLSESDLQLRWRDVTCPKQGGAYFCNQRDRLEVALPESMVNDFLAGERDDFPVIVDRRTKIDWRISKAEFQAVLAALQSQR